MQKNFTKMKISVKVIALSAAVFGVLSCVENTDQEELQYINVPISLDVVTEQNVPQTKASFAQEVLDEAGNVFATLECTEESADAVFPTESAPETKATLVDDVAGMRSVFGNTFTVSAYKGATAVFSSLTATYTSGSRWDLSTVKYWPVGQTYEFFGYTSSTPTVTFSQNGSPSTASFSYSSPASDSNQKDFLLGYYKGTGNSGAAPMHFTHPLTAVCFEFGSFPQGIYIEEISLTGIHDSGSCVASFSNSNGHTPTYTWTTGSSTRTYTQTFSDIAPASVSAVPFVLVPQTFAAGSASSIRIKVKYGGEVKYVTAKISSSTASKTWVAGKKYIYKLTYSTSTGISVNDQVVSGVKSNLVITNTGTAPEYIRAAIVGCWKDASGKVVAPWVFNASEFEGLPGTGWVHQSDGYYYYLNPVLPGRATATKLFTKYTAPAAPVSGAKLELTIIAQAVIWDPSKTLVGNSWAGKPGSLTTTPEQ